MNKTTKGIGISAGVIAIIVAAFMGGQVINDNTYYCESGDIFMECDHFSNTGGRCYPLADSNKGYKDCDEGWIKASDVVDIKPTTTVSSTTTTTLKDSALYHKLVSAKLTPSKEGEYTLTCESPEGLEINIKDVCVPAFRDLKELYKFEKER